MRSVLLGVSIIALALCSACGIMPSKSRVYDADEEFAKVDQPEVGSVEDALRDSAIEAAKRGENDKAVSLYTQLYDRDKKNPLYQLGLAESLRRLGEHQAAIRMYDAVLKEKPDHVDAMEGKALAVMAMGETEEAARLFKGVLEKDKARWRTLNALGILFTIKEMTAEAFVYFNEALKYSADNPSILNNIGLVQAMDGNQDEAVSTLKRAARSATGTQQRQVELNLALVYGIAGQMELAKKVAEPHLSADALTNNLGLYAHLSNDDELAKSYLNMALTNSSTYYERAWKNLNLIDASKGAPPTSEKPKSFKVDKQSKADKNSPFGKGEQ
jgi:Flp pilus assembly protein TadD